MTEDGEVEKNFRSSYYGSLGFRAGEKSLGYLKGLLKAEVLGNSTDMQANIVMFIPAASVSMQWIICMVVFERAANLIHCLSVF